MAKAKQPNISELIQPDLIQPENMAEVPALIAAAKTCVHNGKIASKDEQRTDDFLQYYLACGSLRKTAKHFAVSPNTIKAVLSVYEQAGKLDALKQRLSDKLGLAAELATDLAIDALHSGAIPPNVLPIMMGVALDKKAQLDGEPTQRVEVTAGAPLQAGDLVEYLRTKGIQAPALDVESTVCPAKPLQLQGQREEPARLATHPTPEAHPTPQGGRGSEAGPAEPGARG